MELNDIIAPARTEKAKWDKIRVGSAIFLGLFILGTSAYFGYWYATDWQDMKVSKTILPQQFVNETCDNKEFCPLNITELIQNTQPKDLNTLISY